MPGMARSKTDAGGGPMTDQRDEFLSALLALIPTPQPDGPNL